MYRPTIKILFAFLTMFTLTACGGKTAKVDEVNTEKRSCKKDCDKENCDKENCHKKKQPELSAESKAAMKPNDGTRQIGDVTSCPVSGKVFTITDSSPKTEHEGKTYYFCCDGCVDKFKADPAKFLSGAIEPKVSPESMSKMMPNDGTRVVGDITMCPVSETAFTVTADSPKVELEGKTYYLCCQGCVEKFRTDPAKFLAEK